MTHQYTRWYDKDEYVSAFMMLLEKLPHEIQIEIAQDMLLNLPTLIDSNYDDFINVFSKETPVSYKRWYDCCLELHCAVESMKNLSKEKNAELISMISDIVFKYTSKDFNEEMEKLISRRKEEEDEA